ncbi:AraC-like protein [Paraburkholderia rhizosphaerae]|uniref:AraC-like protein n=2 Tax=Paraburkholderia rhizosphaerae TaxID=480658 RepID=A0A4R8LL83_9BURK|nr:AraC-like protein [Paraburkholderia rhizosphaerae]
MFFATHALSNTSAKTEEEWRALVRNNWSMECDFASGGERALLTTSWFMGDLRFEAADLSRQQWIWSPGPGCDNWRKNAVVIYLIESGIVEIEQDGSKVQLTESSLLVLLDARIPYMQTSTGNSRGMILRVPKSSLEERAKTVSGHEMFMLDSTSPDVALLRSLLGAAAAYGERCSEYGSRLVADHLIDLMEIITDDRTDRRRKQSSDVMLKKVKQFIERNVGNEDLGPEMIANATGISKRYLTRLFERDGSSVMRYLLQQRLERAKKILSSGGERVRICDVAWQCGFVSAAHFSRAFKNQYGNSPTVFQRDGAGADQSMGQTSSAESVRGETAGVDRY